MGETNANAKMIRKSNDSSKLVHSFGSFVVFLPIYILDTSSDMSSSFRNIRLETKSMAAKFDVGGQKMMNK